ncbi:MAG: primase-helicase zinc-binding domain-containing protein, partial [Chloroflexota bacterium]
MLDVAALKQSVDLLALVGDATRLRKVASTRGGEYAGPCPFCGGKDRFRVQPERGQWWCRTCSPDERWQDAIAYVERRDGVDFREAYSRLAGGGVSA